MASTATDRAAIERAIRAAASAVISDPERVDQICRLVSAAVIDPMQVLREAEGRVGRRNSANAAARLLVDDPRDPLAVEAMAQNLRRMRRKAEKRARCSVHALAAE